MATQLQNINSMRVPTDIDHSVLEVVPIEIVPSLGTMFTRLIYTIFEHIVIQTPFCILIVIISIVIIGFLLYRLKHAEYRSEVLYLDYKNLVCKLTKSE